MPRKDPYTLVVIDMQKSFRTSAKVVKPVEHLVLKAKQDGMPVVLVEYCGHGSTISSIERIWEKCKGCRVIKNHDGDGEAILKAIQSIKGSVKNIVVCGVNTCFCVKACIEGMSSRSRNSRFVVYKNTTNCNYPPTDPEKVFAGFKSVTVKNRFVLRQNAISSAA